jgi:hypothetical protein
MDGGANASVALVTGRVVSEVNLIVESITAKVAAPTRIETKSLQ